MGTTSSSQQHPLQMESAGLRSLVQILWHDEDHTPHPNPTTAQVREVILQQGLPSNLYDYDYDNCNPLILQHQDVVNEFLDRLLARGVLVEEKGVVIVYIAKHIVITQLDTATVNHTQNHHLTAGMTNSLIPCVTILRCCCHRNRESLFSQVSPILLLESVLKFLVVHVPLLVAGGVSTEANVRTLMAELVHFVYVILSSSSDTYCDELMVNNTALVQSWVEVMLQFYFKQCGNSYVEVYDEAYRPIEDVEAASPSLSSATRIRRWLWSMLTWHRKRSPQSLNFNSPDAVLQITARRGAWLVTHLMTKVVQAKKKLSLVMGHNAAVLASSFFFKSQTKKSFPLPEEMWALQHLMLVHTTDAEESIENVFTFLDPILHTLFNIAATSTASYLYETVYVLLSTLVRVTSNSTCLKKIHSYNITFGTGGATCWFSDRLLGPSISLTSLILCVVVRFVNAVLIHTGTNTELDMYSLQCCTAILGNVLMSTSTTTLDLHPHAAHVLVRLARNLSRKISKQLALVGGSDNYTFKSELDCLIECLRFGSLEGMVRRCCVVNYTLSDVNSRRDPFLLYELLYQQREVLPPLADATPKLIPYVAALSKVLGHYEELLSKNAHATDTPEGVLDVIARGVIIVTTNDNEPAKNTLNVGYEYRHNYSPHNDDDGSEFFTFIETMIQKIECRTVAIKRGGAGGTNVESYWRNPVLQSLDTMFNTGGSLSKSQVKLSPVNSMESVVVA